MKRPLLFCLFFFFIAVDFAQQIETEQYNIPILTHKETNHLLRVRIIKNEAQPCVLKSLTISFNGTSDIKEIESQCKSICTSIESFSEQTIPVMNSLKTNELYHFNAITKQLGEQEKRLNTEFDVVRKQNKIFSFVIIVLLATIMGLIVFYK